MVQEHRACEEFGADRADEIDALIKAATGEPCPGRLGGQCPLASTAAPPLRLVV